MSRKFHIKNLAAIQSIELIIKNPLKSGYILLMDILIILTLVSFQKILSLIVELIQTPGTAMLSLILLISYLIYPLIQILIFSLFSLKTLDIIKSIFHPTNFKLKRVWKFFLLNIILGLIISMFAVFIGLLIYNTKPELIVLLSFTTLIPVVILSYLIASLAQPLFYETNSIKQSIKNSLTILTKKMTLFLLLRTIIVLLVLYLLYSFLYINSSFSIKPIVLNVFFFLIYVLFFINRISFYKIVLNTLPTFTNHEHIHIRA